MNNIYRRNGVSVDVKKNTTSKVLVNPDSMMYKNIYMKLGRTDATVINSIFTYMDSDINTIQIGGDTLKAISKHTGYNDKVIRNSVSNLKKESLIQPTTIRGEYLVNPLLATKGDVYNIWRVQHKIHCELVGCEFKFPTRTEWYENIE